MNESPTSNEIERQADIRGRRQRGSYPSLVSLRGPSPSCRSCRVQSCGQEGRRGQKSTNMSGKEWTKRRMRRKLNSGLRSWKGECGRRWAEGQRRRRKEDEGRLPSWHGAAPRLRRAWTPADPAAKRGRDKLSRPVEISLSLHLPFHSLTLCKRPSVLINTHTHMRHTSKERTRDSPVFSLSLSRAPVSACPPPLSSDETRLPPALAFP